MFLPAFAVLAAAVGTGVAVAIEVAAIALEMLAMSLLAKMFAPSAPGSQLSSGATEEYSGTVEPRRIVYGTQLIGGLNCIPPWCHGTNNQMLDQVLVLAGHECNAITDVFINQEKVLSQNIGPVTGTLNDGRVSSGAFANKIWLRRHVGNAAETLDAILTNAWPDSWTSDHYGYGLAKLYVQYQYDTTTYSGGKPEIRAMVQGKKIYDPRLDTVPGGSVTDSRYVAYSCNPALCIVDYILDPVLGIGENANRIDWVAAVAAANLCDELVAVPLLYTLIGAYDPAHFYSVGDQCTVGSTVYACTVTVRNIAPPNAAHWNAMSISTAIQRRYSCNTLLDCTLPYTDNLRALAASFQGAVLYSAGKWVLLPGHWIAPTFALSDDDVAGGITYNTAIPYANRYNAVRGQFYDPANLYIPTEYPGIRVDADEIADGEGPVWRELQQPGCVDIFEAQRNAIIEQRKSRRKKTWSFPANYGTFGIRPGEFGTLTLTELSISGQYVRCTGWQMDGKAMTMLINLEEVSPSDWFDPATVVYQTATSLATPAPATFISDPVSNLTATGGAGGITFKWLMPAIWHSNLSVELLESLTNDVNAALVIWSGVNTGVFIQKADAIVRYYWVRVRNFAGSTVSVTTPFGANAGLAVSATSVVGPPGPPGVKGADAIVGSLTLEAVVLPADAAGHVTSYAKANGQFVVYLGSTDITAGCTFSLAPNGNLSGLLYTLGGESMLGSAQSAQGQSQAASGYALQPVTAPGGLTVQAQTASAVGTVVQPISSAAQSSQAQTSSAVGLVPVRSPTRFDSSKVRWDSSKVRWSDGPGGGAAPSGPTRGPALGSQVQSTAGYGSGGVVATGGLYVLTRHIRTQSAGFPSFDSIITLGARGPLVYTDTSGNPNWKINAAGGLIGQRFTAGTDAMSFSVSDGFSTVPGSFTVTTKAPGTGTFAIDVSKIPTTGTINNSVIAQISCLNGRPPYGIGLTSQTVANDFRMSSGYYADPANPGWLCGVITATTTLVFNATDSNGLTATATVVITADALPRHKVVDRSLASQSMPEGMVGRPYHRPVLVTSGFTVSAYSVLSGAIPNGMILDPASGLLHGSPTIPGDFTAVIRAATSAGNTDQSYSWHIEAQRKGTRPAVNPGNGYYVWGPRLCDSNDFELLVRGVNQNHFDSTSEPSIGIGGGNTARVFVGGSGTITQWTDCMSRMMTAGVVPIWANNADNAGSDNIGSLTAQLDVLNTYSGNTINVPAIHGGGSTSFLNYMNRYAIMNLYNEWGNNSAVSIYKDVYSAVAMSITSISGNTIHCSGAADLVTASALTLGRITIEGVSGAPDQYLTITAKGGVAGNWTYTFAGAAINGTGGTMRAGMIGVVRGMKFTCPLTWDAPHFAQNVIGFLTIAAAVTLSDPHKNTIGAVHPYGGFETVTQAIQTLTPGTSTSITTKWASQLTSNYGAANPFHGGDAAMLVGVQGLTAVNRVVGAITGNSGTSPNFNYGLTVNSNAGTYVPGTGFIISGNDFRYLCQELAALHAQGVGVLLEEVGGASPPLTVDPSASAHTYAMIVRACEGAGLAGWLAWAMDDGGSPLIFGAFALCGIEAGGVKGHYTSDRGLTGQGQELWNHPDVSWHARAQPASDLTS